MSADAAQRKYITDPLPDEPPAHVPVEPPAAGEGMPGGSSSLNDGSLADRVKQRRRALETRQNETFDLPGYEGILAAEFRLLAWTEGRKIGRVNAEVPEEELQLLYTCADGLLAAHTRFFEVHGTEQVEITETWQTLCTLAGRSIPTDASDRVAMLALLDDVGVMSLWSEYETWRITRGRRINEEVTRDFKKTG